MSAQPLSRIVRQCLAQLVATGAPGALDAVFSPAGFRLQLYRRRVKGTDELLAPFPIKAPNSVTHYLYASALVCPGLPEADQDILRDDVETILFRYLNPLGVMPGQGRTVWLLSETEQQQLMRVMALPPEEEADYIFLTAHSAQWTGPIRGLHKQMGTLAQMFSRHPDFATGKVICRGSTSFLFLAEARSLERLPSGGIGTDGRNVPSRGIFALDPSSYMDALVQLGEEEARGLAVAEFSYAGTCIRAHGPLGIPLYRIPHSIAPPAIRLVVNVATREVMYQAGEPAAAD